MALSLPLQKFTQLPLGIIDDKRIVDYEGGVATYRMM
jgi:hypothetical protein